MIRRLGLALLLACIPVAVVEAQEAPALKNASFESLRGWELGAGTTHGKPEPKSKVEIDRDVARTGGTALRLSGDARTMVFHMVLQTVPCQPGQRVLFTVAGRCRNLRREGAQFVNANAILIFKNAAGQRLGILASPAMSGDRDWIDLHVHALSPEATATVTVGVLSSMSGTAWFDDARLAITHTEPRDAAARASALRALRLHLERTYPHWIVAGKPKPEELPLAAASTNFNAALFRMLAPLKDVHVWFDIPPGRAYTVRGNPKPANWNPAAIRKRLTATLHDRDGHLVGRIGRLGYVGIGNFQQGFDALEEALAKVEDSEGMILDVRANGGGNEQLAWRIAGRFTDETTPYAKAQVRDATLPGLDGFGPAAVRSFAPKAGHAAYRKKVIVLQGPYCVSSTEGFLLMMKALPQVTRMGQPSRGCSGNPQPFPVFSDVTVWVPTWRSLTLDDVPIEGVGIPPDVVVEASHRDGDPTLERALAALR